jgi:phosphoribosylanthranilate isomerase
MSPLYALLLVLHLLQGGSGKSFDWSNLQVPVGLASQGWLLAGGLNPSNVAQAVATAHPTAVDVSSGVCGPDGLAKDHSKVAAFIAGAKQAAVEAQ